MFLIFTTNFNLYLIKVRDVEKQKLIRRFSINYRNIILNEKITKDFQNIICKEKQTELLKM